MAIIKGFGLSSLIASKLSIRFYIRRLKSDTCTCMQPCRAHSECRHSGDISTTDLPRGGGPLPAPRLRAFINVFEEELEAHIESKSAVHNPILSYPTLF